VFHVFGIGPGIIGTAMAGATLVLQEQFLPDEALHLIEQHRVTVHYGVPTVYVTEMRELDMVRANVSSLRVGIVAGAPIGDDLVQRIRETLCPNLHVAYSLTETSSTVSMTRPDDAPEKQNFTVGRPPPRAAVRVPHLDG